MGRIRVYVKHGKTNVVQTKEHPPDDSEHSVYWDDYHKKRREGEDSRSNPDELEYNFENLLWPTKHTKHSELELDVLEELQGFDFSEILTPQEAKILTQIVIENKKVGEIQQVTGLSRQRVHQSIKRIGEKIRKRLGL